MRAEVCAIAEVAKESRGILVTVIDLHACKKRQHSKPRGYKFDVGVYVEHSYVRISSFACMHTDLLEYHGIVELHL